MILIFEYYTSNDILLVLIMVLSSKTFRVFVSSTFSDLIEERNALQERVFPKLRKLCMEHGFRFQAIDLRWGVSEEASLDQQTMKICFEEIERSQKVSPKPNFIILLGNRYGWRPVPYEIPADEFEGIYKFLEDDEDKKLLNEWFIRDDNSVPPVYDLQPRKDIYEDYETWNHTEIRLNHILRKSVEKLGLEEKSLKKYFTSATEQEIENGAFEVLDAQDHVYCFFREINNLYPDISTKDFIDVDEDGLLDQESAELLKQLKKKLTNRLPDENIRKYSAEWLEENITVTHLDKLCEEVYYSLSTIILRQIKQFKTIDPIYKEIEDHQDFGREFSKNFIGRTKILESIDNYLKNRSDKPLIIHGISGSGKTALMAFAAQKTGKNFQDSNVICRFIGATPNSSDIKFLLLSLCHEISEIYGADKENIPKNYEDLVKEFPMRLNLSKPGQPLIIFLDALDQLSDFEKNRNISWLPNYIPENTYIICSTTNKESIEVLESFESLESNIELDKLLPEEVKKIMELWLEKTNRTLQPDQENYVLKLVSNERLPLYLKLVFEQIKSWKSYNKDEENSLSDNINGIIQSYFSELSSDSQHGKVFVSKCLSYLSASRYGLSEDEILDLLSKDEDVLSDFRMRSPRSPKTKKLPVVIWSRFYFDLEPYLIERRVKDDFLMTFYHRKIENVVKEEYLSYEHYEKFHIKIADYFNLKKLNDRKLDEVPWQLNFSKSWLELKEFVCNIEIFLKMSAENRIYELTQYWNNLDHEFDMVKNYQESIKNFKIRNPDEKLLIPVYYQLASFMFLKAKYNYAEKLYLKTIHLNEKIYGTDNFDTLKYISSLAELYNTKKDYKDAESLYIKVLDLTEKIKGPTHVDTATSLNNLAVLINNRSMNYNNPALRDHKGKYPSAEQLFRCSLKIYEEKLGAYHIYTVTTKQNLALLLASKPSIQDRETAEQLYWESLNITEKVLGPKDLQTATITFNLALTIKSRAVLFHSKKDFKTAEKLLKRALIVFKEILGTDHPKTKNIKHHLNELIDLKNQGGIEHIKKIENEREKELEKLRDITSAFKDSKDLKNFK